ncbi:uncharacterized protein [Periplaneta americana]|uniref:uncharacterized protein n=1 Tax=Periplaneta americana TaxID=6978 RepID=UPI0037E9BECC
MSSVSSDESNKSGFLSDNVGAEVFSTTETDPAAKHGIPQSVVFENNWEKKPDWFDMETFRRGQAVAMKYYFAISFSEIITLLMMLTFKDGLAVLTSTGKSHTPFKSFKRYLSTALRIRSWYTDDIWQPGTEGYKNIKAVRNMHETTFRKIGYISSEEMERRFTVEELYSSDKSVSVRSSLYETILQDFQESCPIPEGKSCFLFTSRKTKIRVVRLQVGYTVAQFGFLGSFLLFPEKFGAHGVTDEEMSSFLYLWRCLGYALGMPDQYNLCDGSLESVRERCRDVIRFWVKSNLRELPRDWEHMSRCLAEGVSYYSPIINFELLLMFLCDILDISAHRIRGSLTLSQKVHFYSVSFVFKFLLRLPGMRQLCNWYTNNSIKWAKNAGGRSIQKLQ